MLRALDKIQLEDELPATVIEDEPNWSENYCYIAYDFKTGVGMYLHIGRWLQDPTLWREEIYIYLPDGTTLNYRAIGAGDCSRGPQGALSRYECVEPSQLWRVTFKGPAIHLDRATLLAGEPLPERVMRKMTMDVRFRRAGPIMMYDIADNSSVGRWHYEQETLVDAEIEFEGQRYIMLGGQGWRDHTRGPRHLGKVRGHANVQGKLADGRFFSVFRAWEDRNGVDTMFVNEARIVKDGKFVPAQIVEISRHRLKADLAKPFVLILESRDERLELVGKPLNTLAYSCTPGYEVLYGFAPRSAPLTIFNQPAEFTHGPHIIGGNIETSIWSDP